MAPGSLVEQWRDELFEKFGLECHIYSTQLEQTSPSGNPFDDYARLIVRLDQLSRNEELQDKLCAPGWDLAVFDEAHKLSAHYFGSKLEKRLYPDFPKGINTMYPYILRGKLSVRPAQVGGIDVNTLLSKLSWLLRIPNVDRILPLDRGATVP